MSKETEGTNKPEDITKRKVVVASKPKPQDSLESKIQPASGHEVVPSPVALDSMSTGSRQKPPHPPKQSRVQAQVQPRKATTSKPKAQTAPNKTTSPHQGHEDSSGGGSKKATPTGGGMHYLGVLALIGVVGLGYFSYQEHQTTQALKESLETQTSAVQSLDAELKAAQMQHSEVSTKMEESYSQLDSQIQAQGSRLGEIGGNQDWKLHEARYLLVLAIERLQVTHDVKSAIELLESADARLAQVANPRAIEVRQAIASDLVTLKRAPLPDIQGLWAKLGALSTQLDQLAFYSFEDPTKRPQSEQSAKTQNETLDEETTGWRASLNNSWQELKGLVKVREFDATELSLVLSGNEQQYLLASLKLLVEQARLALLNQDETVFVGSLEDLEKWVGQYFVANQDQLFVLQEISTLKQTDIEYMPPNISGSLMAMDRLIQGGAQQPARAPASMAPSQPKPTEPEPESLEPESQAPEGEETEESEPTSPSDASGGTSL